MSQEVVQTINLDYRCFHDFYLQFQNLENIPETNNNARRSKEQINKEPNKSIINPERHESKDQQDKVEKVEISQETAEIIREFEYIIRTKDRNIIWLAYQQGKVFEKFKENAKIIEMVKQFVSKSTITFKINAIKLFNKHPQTNNCSVSLTFLQNYFYLSKEVCEENASKFH